MGISDSVGFLVCITVESGSVFGLKEGFGKLRVLGLIMSFVLWNF